MRRGAHLPAIPEFRLLAKSDLLKRSRRRPQCDREPDILKLAPERAAGAAGAGLGNPSGRASVLAAHSGYGETKLAS